MANDRRKSGKSDEDAVDSPEVDPSEETFDEYDPDAEHEVDDSPAVEDEKAAPSRRPATKRSARPVRTSSTDTAKDSDTKKGGKGKKFVPTASESSGKSRRQRMADLQQQQKRADRRRKIGLIALCVVLALAVLAWPTFKFVQTSIIQATPRNELGVPAAEAGCLPEETNPATGNQEHVPDGTVVPYPRLPPDSGPHYNEWTDFSEKFYSVEDRPPVEKLVHNLEHGYVLIWYKSTLGEQQRLELQALVNTYSENNPSDKVKAAPWSEQNDGGAFPEGTNVILTRWVADGNDPTNVAKQKAVRLACGQVSGEVLEQFKAKYPATDSPEPNGG
ncbi:DUF3105 domain-containing protein [Propionibacteriaceae bacterium Y1700]|uniref:DUF3105 domain-containing protein n=1 Tax=Microlunatus sp. Y1700 TaxID=3418487 RepID=UPI003DA6F2E2